MASPKPKPKPKPKKGDPKKPQALRFREAARALEVDGTATAFERAFRAIAPPKHIKRRKSETKTPAK